MSAQTWFNAEREAKNHIGKKNTVMSDELNNAILNLNSMPDSKFQNLMLKGLQNSSNRRGGELSEFAINHSNLIRIAFGMKSKTLYEWGE